MYGLGSGNQAIMKRVETTTSPRPKKARQVCSNLTIFLDICGSIYELFVTSGQRVNSTYHVGFEEIEKKCVAFTVRVVEKQIVVRATRPPTCSHCNHQFVVGQKKQILLVPHVPYLRDVLKGLTTVNFEGYIHSGPKR